MCLHAHTHWLKSCALVYLPSRDPFGPDAASWMLADGAVSGLWSRRGKKQKLWYCRCVRWPQLWKGAKQEPIMPVWSSVPGTVMLLFPMYPANKLKMLNRTVLPLKHKQLTSCRRNKIWDWVVSHQQQGRQGSALQLKLISSFRLHWFTPAAVLFYLCQAPWPLLAWDMLRWKVL